METLILQSILYQIFVIGDLKPQVTKLSEEAKTAGVSHDLYYRVRLVPQMTVMPDGTKTMFGAGLGKIRDIALFKKTHTVHFDQVENILASGKGFETLKKTTLNSKGEPVEEQMHVISVKEYAISARWVTEPVFKKGTEEIQRFFVYGTKPDGSYGRLTTRRKNPETGTFKGSKEEPMVLDTIQYLVFDGENQLVARMRELRRVQPGIDAYLKEVEKATPKTNAEPEEVDENNPA